MIEKIYIPTIRRTDNQITYNNLPEELQKRVIMVVDPNELHQYNYDCEYLEVPKEFIGTWTQLAQTRKFIHKHAGSIKYAVLDDDIIIRRRNSKYWSDTSNMDLSKRNATPDEIRLMFEQIDKWLDEDTIGIVGLSDSGTPPSPNIYNDTTDVYSCIFYDGRMISKVIDDMDITSLRIAEDVLFLYEALSRGINTRRSTEWMYDNRSLFDKSLKESRVVWKEMFEEDEQPVNYYQSDAHYDAMAYIQKKYPHGVKIFEKDGKRKNVKYWKKVYKPKNTSPFEDFFK